MTLCLYNLAAKALPEKDLLQRGRSFLEILSLAFEDAGRDKSPIQYYLSHLLHEDEKSFQSEKSSQSEGDIIKFASNLMNRFTFPNQMIDISIFFIDHTIDLYDLRTEVKEGDLLRKALVRFLLCFPAIVGIRLRLENLLPSELGKITSQYIGEKGLSKFSKRMREKALLSFYRFGAHTSKGRNLENDKKFLSFFEFINETLPADILQEYKDFLNERTLDELTDDEIPELTDIILELLRKIKGTNFFDFLARVMVIVYHLDSRFFNEILRKLLFDLTEENIKESK